MWILALIVLVILLILPSWWVKHVINKYSEHDEHYPGTAGQLVEHLVKTQALEGVTVAASDIGDHYDPMAKQVRLAEGRLDQQSLAAVVIAAHEVGHAMQDAANEPLFVWRSRIAKIVGYLQQIAPILFWLSPILLAVSPMVSRLTFFMSIILLLSTVLFHLVTLPVELDASFRKALPILKKGGYITKENYAAADRILWAAALTYVSSAVFSLLNIWRWIRIMR